MHRTTATLAVLALLLGAGCAQTTPFIYRPGGPAAGAVALPARLAVLPFEDATEAYEKKGSVFKPETLWFNLARGGIGGTIEPVTAPLWARSFAQELAASGRFRAVRYCTEAAEAVGDDYLVSGVLLHADVGGAFESTSRFELRLSAVRRQGGQRVWERTVLRTPKGDRQEYDGCGASVTCMNERSHASLNRMLADMFEEAGADLASAIAGKAGARPAAVPPAGGKPAPAEPVDETIRKILEGK